MERLLGHSKRKIVNQSGRLRVFVTRELPGTRWIEILEKAGCRVEINVSQEAMSGDEILNAVGEHCDGVIGQLTEVWSEDLFTALKTAGVKVYSNYAVGYNNVDVDAASRCGIPVGNTPGVLTETTAEMTVALTLAAARRVVEADRFTRGGNYRGWQPSMFLGKLLHRKTVGVIGAGRIGSVYAKMMVEGFKMDLLYNDIHRNIELEKYILDYGKFLTARGESPVTCDYCPALDEVLSRADVVSLHPVLDDTTFHLINAARLGLMKDNAVLINVSRGAVIDEAALVAHCRTNPQFRVGLDVYEEEPDMKPGLVELDNAVIVPHIGSATGWTRQGMAVLAACNVAAILRGYPVWKEDQKIDTFLGEEPPQAAPSIVNAVELKLPHYEH
jgi:hydroxypyruvate reductase 1